MNILVHDPFDQALSAALSDAVEANGLNAVAIDSVVDPSVVDRYRLGLVPCVARIYQGKAVYQINDPAKVATFTADADAAEAAVIAAEQPVG
jgi:hypothetical protein